MKKDNLIARRDELNKIIKDKNKELKQAKVKKLKQDDIRYELANANKEIQKVTEEINKLPDVPKQSIADTQFKFNTTTKESLQTERFVEPVVVKKSYRKYAGLVLVIIIFILIGLEATGVFNG